MLTATTIVSGSLAERAQFEAYVAYTPVVVYPVVVHWAVNGWLTTFHSKCTYLDFAGGSTVHLLGAPSPCRPLTAAVGCQSRKSWQPSYSRNRLHASEHMCVHCEITADCSHTAQSASAYTLLANLLETYWVCFGRSSLTKCGGSLPEIVHSTTILYLVSFACL